MFSKHELERFPEDGEVLALLALAGERRRQLAQRLDPARAARESDRRGRGGSPASRTPRAPSTSSSSESPTITASAASTSSSSSAAAKISGLGFTLPWLPDEIHASTSIPKCRTNASRSRLVFETRPSFRPCASAPRARARRRRRARSAARAPSGSTISRATIADLGPLAAHAPDDVLREAHPDLLVVVELGMPLEIVDRGGPRVRVQVGVEPQAVRLA